MIDFIYLSWLNPLGGFDYWLFTGYKDHALEIVETGTTTRNVFPGWPKSYGGFADTITKQTFRKTRKTQVIRSQILTATQATELGEQIKSSPLVQIITSRRDRRTVIVDSDSLVVRKESNKVHTLSFTITFTDDYANQHV